MLTWIIITAIVTLSVGAALTFWNEISDLMHRNVLPLIRAKAPQLEALLSSVFQKFERVTVPAARFLQKQWQKLRTWLVGQLVVYERKGRNRYVQRVTSYLRERLESGETRYYEHETVKQVNPIDIPAAFRDQVIGLDRAGIDTTRHADELINRIQLEG